MALVMSGEVAEATFFEKVVRCALGLKIAMGYASNKIYFSGYFPQTAATHA